jgi:anaerobic magnesium-protoporphyrin IX monomethyl ester cyclase
LNDDSIEMAFLFPPGGNFWNFQPHLGVAYIQAYLANKGIVSKQVIPSIGSTLNNCVEQLLDTNAKIIGFTCYDHNYFIVRIIASFIKRKRPETYVIIGGPAATFSDELILANCPDIDLCVRFEGEETSMELASSIKEGSLPSGLEDIAGITYRSENSIIRNPDRELFGSIGNKECGLDGLPSPYLEGILKGNEGIGILSSRGCTQHCTFCNYSAMSKHTIRYHSIERIIDELKYIQTAIELNPPKFMGVNYVEFLDDNFTLDIRRAKKLLARIIDEEIRLPLLCNCRPENVDEELAELLSQAGFFGIFLGIESAVPRVLSYIKRVRNIEAQLSRDNYGKEKYYISKIRETIALAKRNNIKTYVGSILGLPSETLEDGQETIEFINELDVDYYAQNYLKAYAGTELFNTANNYGIRIEPSIFLLPYNMHYAYPVHEIPFGDNSSLQEDLIKTKKQIFKAFAGGPDTCFGIENGIDIAVIKIHENYDFNEIFNWLSKYIALDGKVFILGMQRDTIENFDLMQKVRLESFLPAIECYYLRKLSDTNLGNVFEIVNKPLHGSILHWNPRFCLIGFKKARKLFKESRNSSLHLIYCLEKEEDVYFLADESKRLAESEAEKFFEGVFLDGCRWSRGLCPALKLKRIIVNQDDEVLPCITGLPLGRMNEDIRVLRQKASLIFEQTCKNRQCKGCPANSRCSKCLFTDPFSEEEFCELQRSNFEISGFVARSKIANTFNPSLLEDL